MTKFLLAQQAIVKHVVFLIKNAVVLEPKGSRINARALLFWNGFKSKSEDLWQDVAVDGDGDHFPGNNFAAVEHGGFHCVFKTAAAGHFHAGDGDAFDVVEV